MLPVTPVKETANDQEAERWPQEGHQGVRSQGGEFAQDEHVQGKEGQEEVTRPGRRNGIRRPKGAKHKSLRKKVFKRDNGICCKCGRNCDPIDKELQRLFTICIYKANAYMREMNLTSFSAWHMDHVIPRHAGGLDEVSNLRTLCQWCHTERHQS